MAPAKQGRGHPDGFRVGVMSGTIWEARVMRSCVSRFRSPNLKKSSLKGSAASGRMPGMSPSEAPTELSEAAMGKA
jgi:hypothetical protein